MDERARRNRKRTKDSNVHQKLEVRRSSMPKHRKKRKLPYVVLLGLLIVMMGVYFTISLKYKDVFLPNTTIGGIPISGLTVEEVKADIAEDIRQYQLVMEERGGGQEVILGRDISLQPIFDGSLEMILNAQNSLLWGIRFIKGECYQNNYMVCYDKAKLETVISMLDCMNPEQITEPANAYLFFKKEEGLQIASQDEGDAPIPEQLSAEVEKAVSRLAERINLEELNIYKKPDILANSPQLVSQKKKWELYTNVTVIYHFGSSNELLEGDTILQWLDMDDVGNVIVDRVKVEEYVQEMSVKYNTAYCTKNLKTSYGQVVTITKGHYGWMIDKESETDALMEIIKSGENREREPIYKQSAASHDGPDFGDTYVEMNLTAQHLFFYKNGKLLIDSDFVSGDETKGWSTPAGAYEITYKQMNATLKGKNYKTPVTYWMPFNGNIGMHDGYWRTSFGGTIYKKNGSHGCINLPPAVAKSIYENIEAGTPVLCYHLENTETQKITTDFTKKTTGSSEGKNETASPVKTQPKTVVETVPTPETAHTESAAEQTSVPETPVEPAPAATTASRDETISSERMSEESGNAILQGPGDVP